LRAIPKQIYGRRMAASTHQNAIVIVAPTLGSVVP
jgi:hypothetical protein